MIEESIIQTFKDLFRQKSKTVKIKDNSKSVKYNVEITPSGNEYTDIRRAVNKLYKQGKDLKNTELSGVRLNSLKLQGINFEGANLSNSYFVNADFTQQGNKQVLNQSLNRPIIKPIDYTSNESYKFNANFANAMLNGADFSGANLKNVNFFGAKMSGVNFENATIDKLTYNTNPTEFEKNNTIKKKKYRLVENQRRQILSIPKEILVQASNDLSDLEFEIFKLARLEGLNNQEIHLRIAADPDLGKEYPLNTRGSVKTLISRINRRKDKNGNTPYQIPPLMKGRDPDENLLQAFLLKAKKTPTLYIVRLLYHGVDEGKKINSIDANYSKKRSIAFRLFSEGNDNSTIIKQIFPQLVVNRPENAEDAKKLINFWRQAYETKVSQSNK